MNATIERILAGLGFVNEKEAPRKTEGGESYPASAYLVVEDPDSPTTWHLRVRDAEGQVDRRLLGAAYAALHGGYRGNKYEGPQKDAAIAKLNQLREGQDMEPPEAEKEAADETKSTEKAGARHSLSDRNDMQAIHDLAVKQGAECPFAVTKDAQGKHRWTLFSTSAYQDRDREIISEKAHAADIAHMDETGDYGVLRWWHMGRPEPAQAGEYRSYKAGPGLDLGRCDFSAMQGRVRIESGTFYDEGVGAAVKEAADQLSVSLGFSHPLTEPDSSGVFEHVHTFERSLLPQGVESNLLADVPLIAKEKAMDEKKLTAFRDLVGEELAAKVLAQADSAQKAADETGLKFKASDKIGEMTMDELKEVIAKCMGPEMDAMKALFNGQKDKAAGEYAEVAQSVKQTNELLGQIGQALKVADGQSQALAARVKTLEGDVPPALQHVLRASADPATINPKVTVKENEKAHPLAGFLDFVSGQPGGAASPAGMPPAPAKAG